MFEKEKNLLKTICQKSNPARQEALETELKNMGIRYENWGNMALVVPSMTENAVVVCAHYDAVPGSFGYNDNGMAVLTVLSLIHKLPANVEFLFTNCEEMMALGAKYYLDNTNKKIKGCINLDVTGCFDQVYLDTMNCRAAASLSGCKQGIMPFCDAHAFANRGIPSVTFSSGPSDTTFRDGIMQICSTIHKNYNDNNFALLNFEMIAKVADEVKKAVELM